MKQLNLFLSLILILVMGTAASAQTVDDVISKATAAMGGQSAIDGVKSLRMSMTGTAMGGETGMEILIVKPNNKMIKMTINGMEVALVHDSVEGSIIEVNSLSRSRDR
jgi:hypothetical protein